MIRPALTWTVERIRKGAEFEIEGFTVHALVDTAPKACATLCGVGILEGKAAVASIAVGVIAIAYVVRRKVVAKRQARAEEAHFSIWDIEC